MRKPAIEMNWKAIIWLRRSVLRLFLSLSAFGLFSLSLDTKAQSSIFYLRNNPLSVGGTVHFGNDQWIAQSFRTGIAPEGYIFDFLGPAPNGNPGSIVTLYTDGGGIPGNDLGNYVGLELSPSTTYWIVATAIFSQSTGYGYWQYPTDSNYSSLDNWSIDLTSATYALSSDGSSWLSFADHSPFKFGIAATAVPEPQFNALVAFGVLPIVFYQLTKRSRSTCKRG
jgi:hypothetical protein